MGKPWREVRDGFQGQALLEAAGGHVIGCPHVTSRREQQSHKQHQQTGDCRIQTCVHGCRRFGSFVTKVGCHLHTMPVDGI